jgi:protein-L-isoaspartate(D-aspartate) O-methyltransferase
MRILALATLAVALVACAPSAPTPTVAPLASFTPTIAPLASPPPATARATDEYTRLRKEMVVSQIQSRGVSDSDVLAAMNAVLRHQFVLPEFLDQAYEDHPLPIGYGQTISQPYIVALMTEKLRLKRGDVVLEIGTGSGYQAAVLAQLGVQVYSVEIVPELAKAADERLKQLGYAVSVKQGDGYYGWPEHAPYDAIIVTAAPDHVPQPLVKQLKDGGRLVIPVGPQGGFQTLWQFTRAGEDLKAVDLGGVAFVPLVTGR